MNLKKSKSTSNKEPIYKSKPREFIVENEFPTGILDYVADNIDSLQDVEDFIEGAMLIKEFKELDMVVPDLLSQAEFYVHAKNSGNLEGENSWYEAIQVMNTLSEIYANVLPVGKEFAAVFFMAKKTRNPNKARRIVESLEAKLHKSEVPETSIHLLNGYEEGVVGSKYFVDVLVNEKTNLLPNSDKIVFQTNYRNDPSVGDENYVVHLIEKELK